MVSLPQTPTRLTARDINRERVSLYCRVSSDEQAQAGTVENQIDFGRRYCDLHGLTLHAIYTDEGVSGTMAFADRPGGAQSLADAAGGQYGTLLVYRIDRLARSTRVLLDASDALKASGVTLRSMSEPFDTSTPLGEFIMTMLGSLAALERATIIERMTLGKHRAAREGRWLGGAPPFGYTVEGPERDRRLVIQPEQAEIVRRIFKLYVHEGMGLIPIMELLNAEDVPSPYAARGQQTKRWPEGQRRWNTGTLSRLLHNTAYVGRYRAGARSAKEIAEYETPRIVDDEIFAAAGRLLGERFVEASRNSRRLYLLRGLITCFCGRAAAGDGNHTRGQFYYVCTGTRSHFRFRAEVLEDLVWRDIAAYARDPGPVIETLRERLRERLDQAQDLAGQIAAVRQQLEARQAEQSAVITLYRKGRITEAQLDEQLDHSDAEIATLNTRLQTLFDRQVEAQSQETATLSAEAILTALRDRVDEIERAEPGEALALKRPLVRGLVAGIRVQPDGPPIVTYHFAARDLLDSSVHKSSCTELSNAARLERVIALESVAEAAARLGVSRSYLSRLARQGEMGAIRPTDHYYLPAGVQLPARLCVDCGVDLGRPRPNQACCEPCRKERRRQTWREAARRKAEAAALQ